MRRERWLPIPGFDGYEVSDQGRVRSRRRYAEGRILKSGLDTKGYVRVNLQRGASSECNQRVHVLVMRAFVGYPPAGHEVRHLDGDRRNNDLQNLTYGTHAENMQDMRRHGTNPAVNRTHCPQQHPYDETNTRLYRGRRYCRECGHARNRARAK